MNSLKGVALTILNQYPTCTSPTFIERIETRRYNLILIGRSISHSFNSNLHSPNHTYRPPSDTSNTSNPKLPSADLESLSTDNLPSLYPIANPINPIPRPSAITTHQPFQPTAPTPYNTSPTTHNSSSSHPNTLLSNNLPDYFPIPDQPNWLLKYSSLTSIAYSKLQS